MTDIENERLLLSNQLCFPLYAAARKVVGLYTPVLSGLGLTYTQYIALLALWERDGVSVTELGGRLMLDSGTLSPVLKKLEGAGYLTRQRSREDERQVLLFLTEQGRLLKERAAFVPEKIGSCLRLSPEDAAALYVLLYKILADQTA